MFSKLKSKFKAITQGAKLVKACYNQLDIIKKDPSSPEAKEAGYKFLWMIKELYAQYKKEGFKSFTNVQFLEDLANYPNNESEFRKKAEEEHIIQDENGQMQVKSDPQASDNQTQPLDSFGKDLLQQISKNVLMNDKENE